MVAGACTMEGLVDSPMVAVKNPPPGSEMLLFCLHEEGVGRVGWCLSERRERERGHHPAIAPPSLSGDPHIMASSKFNHGKLAST